MDAEGSKQATGFVFHLRMGKKRVRKSLPNGWMGGPPPIGGPPPMVGPPPMGGLTPWGSQSWPGGWGNMHPAYAAPHGFSGTMGVPQTAQSEGTCATEAMRVDALLHTFIK